MNDWLLADAQIRAITHRYALALDQRDVASISELFSADAEFGRHGTGPDGARSFYAHIWRRFGRSVHTIGTQVIDVHSANSATGVVYCRAEQEDLATEVWNILQFAYHDEYVREDEQWRFRSRAPRFWYRESGGVRTLADEPSALPASWDSWRRFWDEAPGSDT